MATPQHIILLLEKLFQEQPLSEQEKQSLKEWFSSNRAEDALLADPDWDKGLTEYLSFVQNTRELDQALSRFNNKAGFTGDGEVAHDINTGRNNDNDQHVSPVHRVHFLRKWGWAAASIILILGMGAYLWTTNKKNIQPPVVATTPADIAPGKNGAILTLADGSQVVLDSLSNGVVATQNGAKVLLQNGGLAYDATGAAAGKVTYNTMTTPKGRQFQVVLPDGTRVWLNAASSIRYPTAFAGKERKVEVTGEAYFEVAKNMGMPFRVNINGRAEVEVLGTHFNVNAYGNEDNISTTLLEGKVRVAQMQNDKKAPSVILKPGQQARVANQSDQSEANESKSSIQVVHDADIDKVMAWKNGFFNFEGQTFKEVLRQLERWYDIEVVFEGRAPDVSLGGNMNREVSLSGVLNYFDKENIHYRLEGRKLTILP